MNIKTNKPKHTNRNTNLALFSIENFLRKILFYDRSGKSGEEDPIELINFYYKLLTASRDLFHGQHVNETLFIAAGMESKNGTPLKCPSCGTRFDFQRNLPKLSTPTAASNG